jgi:putative transposase
MDPLSSVGLKRLNSWVSNKFTYEFLERKSRESGFLRRKRKLDPVYLVLVLIFGISNHQQPTMEETYRRYVDFDDSFPNQKTIRNQSFRNRFNKRLVDFLKELLEHYIDQTCEQSPARLKGIVQGFKDILIQDSSIIRLSKKLYELHPAARSRDNSAGLKIHAIYSTVYHSIQSAVITTERTHDAKIVKITSEVQNTLLINDLGYYSLKTFSKIHNLGGFFISRVKSNAIPEVSSILSIPSDFSSIIEAVAPIKNMSLKCS